MTSHLILEQSPDYVRAISPYRAGKPIEELAREYGLNPQAIDRKSVV